MALLLLCACGGGKAGSATVDVPGISKESWAPVDFAFDSLDDRPVTSESTRGQVTVLVFVETGSLASQAQVDFVVAMAKNDGDRVHYAVVALEPGDSRELVEVYRRSLGITFPVAMADATTASGGGPFGDVTVVPVTVVLDREGRLVWRLAGRVAKSAEIRAQMRGR